MRPRSRLNSGFRRRLLAALLCVAEVGIAGALIAPARAAEAHRAVDPTTAEMQRALESAVREARSTDDLDPAYELLSLIDTAQQFQAPQVAAGASAAFSDLVGRATATALKHAGSPARDTLDQFVDLRSAAYNAPEAQAALDKAMNTLFPAVSGTTEKAITATAVWDDKLAKIADLGQLQASAIQVKMTTVAAGIGSAFDVQIASLRAVVEQESDGEIRATRTHALDDAVQARLDHVSDASANNIDVMASRMQASPADTAASGGAHPASAKD